MLESLLYLPPWRLWLPPFLPAPTTQSQTGLFTRSLKTPARPGADRRGSWAPADQGTLPVRR